MGDAFGTYELLQPLATGGMGQLYLARSTRAEGFQKLVVIKMLLSHLSRDSGFTSMFLDEARIAARLNHPNICHIFDLGEVAGVYYLAMEFVPGVDLRTLARDLRGRGQLLPPPLACRIAANAAAGLHCAHELTDDAGQPLHLVHRDVSPSNVMVSFEGAVKVIDFGVARAAGRTTQTAGGQLKGKFAYMSPEQAEGEDLDGRSDEYALGLVLHELLTGQQVLQRDSDAQTLRAAREGVRLPPSALNPSLPKELDEVVMRALAPRREDRYPTLSELGLALEAWLLKSQQPASAAHLAAFLRATYPDHKERSRASATPTPHVSTPSGPPVSGLTRTALSPGSRSTPAPPAVSPRRRLAWAALAALVLMPAGGLGLWRLLRAPPPAPPPAPAVHRLQLVSEPLGAELFVDGVRAGTTPLEHAVEHGRTVRLGFRGDALEPLEQELRVERDQTVRVTLRRRTVRVGLTSSPSGATVSRRGESVGTTPLELDAEAGLPQALTFSLKGYLSKEVQVVTNESGPFAIVELVRAPRRSDSPFAGTEKRAR